EGLALDAATGLISGTLTRASAGVHPVTATASDGSLTSTQSFTWTVTHENHAPALAAPANQTSPENATVSLQLSASDADGDPLTYAVTVLPASLSVDATSGLTSGTLSFTSAGSYAVIASVSDGTVSASHDFTWTVANTNRAPTLANPGPQTSWDLSGYPQ